MSASIYSNSSFTDSPYGLKLQQTFTTSGSVTIPTGINRVYAIVIGGGGAGGVAPVALSATVTAATGNGTTITYTANNSFAVGRVVTVTGLGTASGTTLNVSNQTINGATATQFTIPSATVGVSSGTGTAIVGGGFGGGGAGGYSAGWTYVSNTVTVGTGGVGTSTPNTAGAAGNPSIYGMVMAGGGGGGAGNAAGGPGGGAVTPAAGVNSSVVSYTGAPVALNGQVGYAGGPAAGVAAAPGVSSGGARGNTNPSSSATADFGGRGLICGGGGSTATVAVSTGGAGGTGDFYAGGTGSTGTGVNFGAGGGGAGFTSNGGNASGIVAGNGGSGGGGGGGAGNAGTGGSGGNGVVYLYY